MYLKRNYSQITLYLLFSRMYQKWSFFLASFRDLASYYSSKSVMCSELGQAQIEKQQKIKRNLTVGYSTQQKIIEVAVLRGRASEQKTKLEEREQKMHVKKRPLNPSCCCSCSQLRQQRQQQQSSAYFMAFFAMAVGAFGRLGQPTELLSDLPCRA